MVKFVSFSYIYYPRLVRMLYANLSVMLGKLSTFVMNREVVIDVKTMVKLFDMDRSTPFNLAKNFKDFRKFYFQNNLPTLEKKILTIILFVEDRLLY